MGKATSFLILCSLSPYNEYVSKGLFGTSCIRGDAKELFTNQFAFDLGRSFSIFLKNHGKAVGCVACGMDPRDSSPRIKSAFGSGIVQEKLDFSDEGVAPIPAINSILIADENYIGSAMISGSHIKDHLNGIKFFAFHEEITKEHEREIENIYDFEKEKIKYQDNSDKFFLENRANDTYVEYLLDHVQEKKKWKLVVDPGGGAQTVVMPKVFEILGHEVIKLNSTIQENFLSRDTEVEGDFLDLQKKVVEEKCDFGIGYDSDGDRVIFIDENGKYITGDYMGVLIAKESGFKKVVTPINSSQVVDECVDNVIRTKVGSPYVVAAMKENDCEFGYEANGGCIFSEMKSRDGGRTSVVVIDILSKSGLKLSELVGKLPKYFIHRDKVEYELSDYEKIITVVKERYKDNKIEETDGMKIWIDGKSWILYRSSQNAPEFRVFVESDSEEKSKKLLQEGLELVKSVTEHA